MRASKKVKGAVLLTAGAALILGAPTVYADDNNGASNSNQGGLLLNGDQLLNNVSLNIPVNACGIGALLGQGEASCRAKAGNGNGGNAVSFGRHGGQAGDGGDSRNEASNRNRGGLIGNGLQVGNNLSANVPVNACGVGAILGSGEGRCAASAGNDNGGNAVHVGTRGYSHRHGGNAGDGGDSSNRASNRNHGGLILNGVQALNNVSLNVPIDLCGVGLLLAEGDGNCAAAAGNGNGGSVYNGGHYYRGSDGRDWRDYRYEGREWREDRGGSYREYWDGGSWHNGNAGDGGDSSNYASNHNRGGLLLNGLQLLNNVSANVPVTVCGLAVLGTADCGVNVEAGNDNGGSIYHRNGCDGDCGWHHVGGEHRHWENEVLPETGAAGLALLPFGLALVAGGVALRRRVSSQR